MAEINVDGWKVYFLDELYFARSVAPSRVPGLSGARSQDGAKSLVKFVNNAVIRPLWNATSEAAASGYTELSQYGSKCCSDEEEWIT